MGGAERSLLDILTSLRQAKPAWDLHLVAGENGPLVAAAKSQGIQTHVLPLPPELARLGDWGASEVGRTALLWRMGAAGMTGARYVGFLRALLVKIQPQVVHTNGFKMHLLGAWSKPAGVPLVWHVHDYVQPRALMARLLRIHLAKASLVIANSASVAIDVRAAFGERIRVETLWNAIDLAEFSPPDSSASAPRLDLDAACGLPSAGAGVVRFGLVGTLAKWKGHDVFLRALAKVSDELPVRGYVVGGPLYRTEASQWSLDDLKKMASQLGLEGNIGFTGFLPRPAEAMRALDVVVHASTRPEPFGLVIVEAMGCGRAVIVSAAGGALELIRDGENALAHAPGDSEGLAAAMVKLARDRALRERIGVAGRRTAERDFDKSRLGRGMAPIFDSVTGKAARAA
jgi:glycosyltransferase involved in cell wall biosynthesis